MWDAHTCITEHSQHYSKLILGGIVLNSTEWYQLVLGTLFLHNTTPGVGSVTLSGSIVAAHRSHSVVVQGGVGPTDMCSSLLYTPMWTEHEPTL